MQVSHVKQPRRFFCVECGKKPVSSLNRPHSLKRTKRTIWPNLQKFKGQLLCTRCLRTKRSDKAA